MRFLFLLLMVPVFGWSQTARYVPDVKRWQQQAQKVTITRDDWGIPHIEGPTDADVVFGLMYAQCEDDFYRVEHNYILGLGRSAELAGESRLYHDLYVQAYSDSVELKKQFSQLKPWLQKLMTACADGINYYLYKHPEVKPKLLTRFQPWYPLVYSEGSSEGNTSNQTDVTFAEISQYFNPAQSKLPDEDHVRKGTYGSNAFAVAPSRTASGKAMIFINPHVSLFHRTEVQLTSKEGLNAYGAVSKGQFFIYHGFNEHCGWAHTTGRADTQDAFEEKLVQKGGQWFYQFGKELRPVKTRTISLAYASAGGLSRRTFQVQYTHHGPILAKRGESWISITPLHQPGKELEQQWAETKANTLAEFTKTMEIRSGVTNNTTYADDKGNIAYWHGNFVPRRDPAYNWSKPVPSGPETEWKGVHLLSEIVQSINPASGFTQSCNATPYAVSGNASPKAADYPFYMATDDQDARSVNAIRLLEKEKAFTMDKLQAAGFDTYLSAFEVFLPALFDASRQAGTMSPDTRRLLEEPLKVLQQWDMRASTQSVATTLAIMWGEKLYAKAFERIPADSLKRDITIDPSFRLVLKYSTAEEKLNVLAEVVNLLTFGYGTWKVPAGDMFRLQRPSEDIAWVPNTQQPSLPLTFHDGTWGSLPSAWYPNVGQHKQVYSVAGNSFVAVVEFGERVKARSIVAGGIDNHQHSKHFFDQAERYSKGQLKDVYFYPDELAGHVEKKYHPGE
ncbi:MAG: penicillin acylase family protein [Cyclobacteriaceae bacterium]